MSSLPDWDAKTYGSLPLPHETWGERVLARLDVPEDATVLDAGCGTGRDTQKLLDRVPRGRVIAVDSSPAMLEQLRSSLGDRAGRVDIVRADLGQPLPVDTLVDAVFSVAAFHWLADRDALFRNLAAVMRPGAQLSADCGGAGNLAAIDAAVTSYRSELHETHAIFETAETTADRLERAGFTDVETKLIPHPVAFPTQAALHSFLAAVVLRPYLNRTTADEFADLVSAVVDGLPGGVVDSVRLDINARRAS